MSKNKIRNEEMIEEEKRKENKK